MSSTATETSRQFWRTRAPVQQYQTRQGWADNGERAAFGSIANEVRGLPVLDLGVGAGRTTSLMQLLTDDYAGVDWSPEMVEACRTEHPDADISQADAQDLSAFSSSRFKLALFSFNGLDNIPDHEGRRRVFAEVHRVLRPDGIFGYSTLSMHGRYHGQRPWHQAPWRTSDKAGYMDGLAPRPQRIARFVYHLPSRLSEYPYLYANWSRNRRLAERHRDWSLSPLASQNFNLIHFTSIEGERAILTEHGFVISDLFASSGAKIDRRSDITRSPWFFVIARKTES